MWNQFWYAYAGISFVTYWIFLILGFGMLSVVGCNFLGILGGMVWRGYCLGKSGAKVCSFCGKSPIHPETKACPSCGKQL